MEKLDPAATDSPNIDNPYGFCLGNHCVSEFQFALYAVAICLGAIIILIVIVIRIHQVTFRADYDSIHHCHALLHKIAYNSTLTKSHLLLKWGGRGQGLLG